MLTEHGNAAQWLPLFFFKRIRIHSTPLRHIRNTEVKEEGKVGERVSCADLSCSNFIIDITQCFPSSFHLSHLLYIHAISFSFYSILHHKTIDGGHLESFAQDASVASLNLIAGEVGWITFALVVHV